MIPFDDTDDEEYCEECGEELCDCDESEQDEDEDEN